MDLSVKSANGHTFSLLNDAILDRDQSPTGGRSPRPHPYGYMSRPISLPSFSPYERSPVSPVQSDSRGGYFSDSSKEVLDGEDEVYQGPVVSKRKYHCSYPGCSKSFTTSGHLARHNRIHTGEKNFTCLYPGCLSRFSRQDNMMQHYRTHITNKSRRANSKRSDHLFIDPPRHHLSLSQPSSPHKYTRPVEEPYPSPALIYDHHTLDYPLQSHYHCQPSPKSTQFDPLDGPKLPSIKHLLRDADLLKPPPYASLTPNQLAALASLPSPIHEMPRKQDGGLLRLANVVSYFG
ncbi:hypothetical protein BZG36_04496 [Bifiguratus adelaidae]|uniref:C2H2-type domain-containing protein n=1 Tax=Bifiguratus adelaidae TaxID=1938954 RepID=A0A261XYD3_9FUNG|nr:hypothetical protein BZG36_04496 [Bifiguratus adelaidae]